jgi:3-hydroxyacyl-CoA dehydrogenase
VIGTGVIGASWTALFLARGLKVIVTDPAPGADYIPKMSVDIFDEFEVVQVLVLCHLGIGYG